MNPAISEKTTITIERRDDGGYDAWLVRTVGDQSTYDQIDTSDLCEPIPYGRSVDTWAASLSDLDLETAILIFTERWTWDTGKEEDRICLEALEVETKFRKENTLTSNQIPPHTHAFGSINRPVNPQRGDLWVNGMNGQAEYFDGNHWHPCRITTQNAQYTAVAGPQGLEHTHAILPNYTIAPAGGKSTP